MRYRAFDVRWSSISESSAEFDHQDPDDWHRQATDEELEFLASLTDGLIVATRIRPNASESEAHSEVKSRSPVASRGGRQNWI